jgi:hypothetical protein
MSTRYVVPWWDDAMRQIVPLSYQQRHTRRRHM